MLRALTSAPHLGNLRSLVLYQTGLLKGHGLQRLASWPGLSRLENLMFRAEELTDPGLRVLARSSHLARLQNLRFEHCTGAANGYAAFAESPHLDNLRLLHLADCGLRGLPGERVREALQARFGNRVMFSASER